MPTALCSWCGSKRRAACPLQPDCDRFPARVARAFRDTAVLCDSGCKAAASTSTDLASHISVPPVEASWAPRSRALEDQRQLLEPAQKQSAPPAKGFGGHRQARTREAPQESAQGDLSLHPGERRSKAVVHAAPPEGEVPVRIAGQVQDVRVLEMLLVTVGRAEHRQNQSAAWYPRVTYLRVLTCVALGRHLHGAGVAQEFLDCRLGERRVKPEPRRLLWMLQESERGAGDQVDGGFVAGHQEQERHGQELVLAQPVARLLSPDQRRDEIVLGLGATPLHEFAEVPYERQSRRQSPQHVAARGDRDQPVRPPVELGMGFRGYSKQFGDDGSWQGQRVAGDQVCP